MTEIGRCVYSISNNRDNPFVVFDWDTLPTFSLQQNPLLPTAYVVRDGKLCFQSVHTWGVPHLHPIIFPLVPCPFQGGTPVTGPRSGLGGYPPARDGVYPPPPDRTADGSTWYAAVCLLVSCWRTFLFFWNIYHFSPTSFWKIFPDNDKVVFLTIRISTIWS